jgi:thymidylate synthase (FAD)
VKVELVDKMGSDLTVVNAARVSFNKHQDKLKDTDERLIKYLAVHGHWTPFGHCTIQFRIAAPIFVARQLVKHQVGLVWNEVSRRYVDYTPELFIVDEGEWRGRPDKAKQGSAGYVDLPTSVKLHIEMNNELAIDLYKQLLNEGVAPEQARMVLPLSTYTEWYWTGSLMAFARVCNLRMSADAQEETQEIARQISEHCAILFPISWKYLVQYSEE